MSIESRRDLRLASGLVLSPVPSRRQRSRQTQGAFSFIQISDSHIGFKMPANNDTTATLKAAVDKINFSQSKQRADLILHTGDVSHTSKPEQFDTARQVIAGANVERVFYIPGEHDTSYDGGASHWEHFGKDTRAGGWYSFDHKDVHFIGLNNVVMLDAMGDLGHQQLDWTKNSLAELSASTPIVVFADVPLWRPRRDKGLPSVKTCSGAGRPEVRSLEGAGRVF